MKKLFTLLVLICCLVGSMDAQVEKTLVKSIATATTTGESIEATLILPGKVTLSEWDNDFIRITTSLRVENMSENIVKQLVTVGRYIIDSKLDEKAQTLTIKMPKMGHRITVKGVDLIESLTFEVQAPKGYNIIIKGQKIIEDDSMLGLGQNL